MKYEISKGTLAIVPEKDERSLVYEDDEKYIIEESPYKIMEESERNKVSLKASCSYARRVIEE